MQVGGVSVWLTLVLSVGCGVAYLQDEHAQFVQSQHRSPSDAVEIWQKPGSALQSRRQKRSIAGGTHGGTANGRDCVFPFRYKGRNYYHCITNNNSGARWCYVRKLPGQSKPSWGNCKTARQIAEERRAAEIILISRRNAREAAERYERTMRFSLETLCAKICVTEWSMWEPCSKPCGRGNRKRTRRNANPGRCATLSNFRCTLPLQERQWCNEGCPHGGTPNNAGCSCKDGWLGTCCQTEVICEYPGKPSHGDVEGTWPAKFRFAATFHCDPGYALVGTELIRCQADQSWTGVQPQCQRITCTTPIQNNNTRILNFDTSYNYGDKVMYVCDWGYVMRGPEMRECKAGSGTTGKWTHFAPVCHAVRCDDPGEPIDGERHGHVFTYGSSVDFTCSTGYKLVGSSHMTCMASRQWLGRFPECVQIQCDPPIVPDNGDIRLRNQHYGALVYFECDIGFNLVGNRRLHCEESGNWNGTEPICEASICDNPGIPAHGGKDGSIYYFPHKVTFSCSNGYLLTGMDTTSCQSDGTWSSPLPICTACPSGTYMDDSHEEKQCITCPESTHTLIEGSTSRLHCVCQPGYTGPAGGPCEEIRCPDLSAPDFGTINECENQLHHSCVFNCSDGYILNKGASMRTCQANGEWDGQQPSCSPCKEDTYKLDVRVCSTCPNNTHTDRVANMLDGCVCDNGYQGPPGGPCVDVDECQDNDTCSDVCENRPGDYKCDCSIPGYKLDPDDERTCIVARQCKNLTEKEAPINGGLVCHWYHEENSQQCTVKCNLGFEFPSRINNYENCGPLSGYTWTFQQENPEEIINPCAEEFFPGIRLEVDSSYFVRNCADLTEEEKVEVKNNYAVSLNENNVCLHRASKLCDIKDMGIICGRIQMHRRKRGINETETLQSIDFAFNITSLNFTLIDNKADCRQICDRRLIPASQCHLYTCNSIQRQRYKAAVLYSKRILERLYQTDGGKRSLVFTAARREFEPESANASDAIVDCLEGMMHVNGSEDSCVPCTPGHYYEKAEDTCLPCPMGMYQIIPQKTSCEMCPEGSTSYNEGSLWCEACRNSTFGERCEHTCQCSENGQCDAVTGDCDCHNGWTGDRCDTDVNGCDNHGCYEGVVCTDIPAPGSGYHCGSCPPGLQGDGAICTPGLQEAVACNPLDVPANGFRAGDHFTFGSEVSFSCYPGYELLGTENTTCQANGQWTSPPPTCREIICPSLPPPANGVLHGGTDLVIFSCHTGYELQGRQSLQCVRNGNTVEWNAVPPQCIAIMCDEPVAPTNGGVLGTDFSYGASVTFSCVPGYTMLGSGTAICLASGWHSQPPTCEG